LISDFAAAAPDLLFPFSLLSFIIIQSIQVADLLLFDADGIHLTLNLVDRPMFRGSFLFGFVGTFELFNSIALLERAT
jgi:hypothetical protein